MKSKKLSKTKNEEIKKIINDYLLNLGQINQKGLEIKQKFFKLKQASELAQTRKKIKNI